MINFNKKKNTGFTLVETLVALFVFSVTVLAVMMALTRGISSTIYAKDKVVAEYLSQEGIEYFRNMRDTFQLFADDKNDGWSKFIEKLKTNGCEENGCYFDNNEDNFFGQLTTDIKILPCDKNCPNFLYDAQLGKYNYNKGSESTFSRRMLLTVIDDNNVKITSETTYRSGSNTNTVSLSENLSNWIE